MIQFKRNDWLVVSAGSKRMLGQAVGRTLLDVGAEEEHRFNPNEVLANLGKNPPCGESVFGRKIDMIRLTLPATKLLAPMMFHTEVTEEDAKEMRIAIHKIAKALDEQGLYINRDLITEIHVRKQSSKTYGYKQGKDNYSHLLLACDKLHVEEAFACSFGLHLWAALNNGTKSRWLALLHKIRRVQTCTRADLEDLMDTYVRADNPAVADLASLWGENENAEHIVRTVVQHFRSCHGMGPRDIDMLCAEDKELLAELWPEWTSFTEQRPDFPKVSLRSPQDLFAYAVYCHLRGPAALPKSLIKPMAFTIKQLKVE